MLNGEGSTQQNFRLRYEGRLEWLKKASSTHTRQDFYEPTQHYSVCSHLRPFLLGLILAFHEVYRPVIVRVGNESIFNRCLSRTAAFAEAGSSLLLSAYR